MEVFQHSGFQTVQFATAMLVCFWLLTGRAVSGRFLAGLLLFFLTGIVGLHLDLLHLRPLPFFVNGFRLLTAVIAASLFGAFVEEIRLASKRLWLAHLVGCSFILLGCGLTWNANWEVSGLTGLLIGFLTLGYCVRENRR